MRDSGWVRSLWAGRLCGASESGRPGLALVVLSVVEMRLDAVQAVLAGSTVVEVAARVGVSRSTLHRWLSRYLLTQLAVLADQSHRPRSCPHQVDAAVEVAVAEMRRLLRVRPNPLTPQQVCRLRGARRARPPPRTSSDPVTVQRRASATG